MLRALARAVRRVLLARPPQGREAGQKGRCGGRHLARGHVIGTAATYTISRHCTRGWASVCAVSPACWRSRRLSRQLPHLAPAVLKAPPARWRAAWHSPPPAGATALCIGEAGLSVRLGYARPSSNHAPALLGAGAAAAAASFPPAAVWLSLPVLPPDEVFPPAPGVVLPPLATASSAVSTALPGGPPPSRLVFSRR